MGFDVLPKRAEDRSPDTPVINPDSGSWTPVF